MLFGNRESRALVAGRRGQFRPKFQALEDRLLLAIDLGGQLPPNLPNVATAAYGMDLAGGLSNGGAGFSIQDVGDINGDGFDDFIVGAPTITNAGAIAPGFGNSSTVYLIFGSNAVNSGNIDWLSRAITANQRVGDLLQLGNTPNSQQNPITGTPTYPFNGIKIIASQTIGGQVGVSVSSVNLGGRTDLLIGAPGELDANGANAQTGRAFLIYGGTNLNSVTNHTIDLDNPTGNVGVNLVTFVNTNPRARTGSAVAGIGDVFGNNEDAVAIGAPFATIGGNANSGAVYLINGLALAAPQTTTINLATVGQRGGVPGVIFSGATAGDQAGFSVADAGNVNGAFSGPLSLDDLLIGAPGSNGGAGAAYLIYGQTNLPSFAITTNNVLSIPLTLVGGTTTAAVPGVTFTGAGPGAQSGYAVASAGDFGGTGLSDILIGSPGFNGTGEATLVYGQPLSGKPLTGTIPLATINQVTPSANFTGSTAGALAGYSLSQMGRLNNNVSNGAILIGSPGFNASEGAVYLIPYNPFNLTGTFSLTTAEAQPLAGTLITITNTAGIAPAFLGASVSSRPFVIGQRTVDSDSFADIGIGAPGYGVIQGRGLDGGAFLLQGALIPTQVPVNTAIQTQIGVGQPFGPFSVNATTPAALTIFVFSNATTNPPFDPVLDIDPTSIVINGVAFPNATIAADPVDENKDGIEDAIITITPRANIGLNANTTTFTISGRTLATSPQGGKAFTGTAAITVTGTTPGGVTPGTITTFLPVGFVPQTSYIPQFGNDQFVPSTAELSRYNYKAIPRAVALRQYLPTNGFLERTHNYFHPAQATHTQRQQFDIFGVRYHRNLNVLPHGVFTRSKFKPGHTIEFTHEHPVVPANRQSEKYQGTPLKHPVPN